MGCGVILPPRLIFGDIVVEKDEEYKFKGIKFIVTSENQKEIHESMNEAARQSIVRKQILKLAGIKLEHKDENNACVLYIYIDKDNVPYGIIVDKYRKMIKKIDENAAIKEEFII